jgi:hypothetical protein
MKLADNPFTDATCDNFNTQGTFKVQKLKLEITIRKGKSPEVLQLIELIDNVFDVKESK